MKKNTDAVWSEAISVYDYDYTSCAYTVYKTTPLCSNFKLSETELKTKLYSLHILYYMRTGSLANVPL